MKEDITPLISYNIFINNVYKCPLASFARVSLRSVITARNCLLNKYYSECSINLKLYGGREHICRMHSWNHVLWNHLSKQIPRFHPHNVQFSCHKFQEQLAILSILNSFPPYNDHSRSEKRNDIKSFKKKKKRKQCAGHANYAVSLTIILDKGVKTRKSMFSILRYEGCACFHLWKWSVVVLYSLYKRI